MEVAYGLRPRLRRTLTTAGEAEQKAAFSQATYHRFRHDEPIISPKSTEMRVHYIHSGRVRLVLHGPNGHDKVVCILGPGAMVGESDLQGLNRHTAGYAMGVTETFSWDHDTALRLLETNQAFTYHVITSLSIKTKLFAAQIEALSFASAAERVACTFSNLAQIYGEPTRQGMRIPLRLTQEDIGEIANASRVTVSKVFNDLKRAGLVTKQNGCFIVRDVEKVARWRDPSRRTA